MVEIEVKIRVEDLKPVREKILHLEAKLEKERFFEENTLFDFPSRALQKKSEALRIRKMNKKTFLTFKGSPQKSRKFKVREEYETEVKNEKNLRNVLKSLGLAPVFNYQKYRAVFRRGRLKICLDETAIGNFIELEGERNEITKFATALGISKREFIKLDYVQLFQMAREKA